MRVITGTAAEHYAQIHTIAVEAFAQHEAMHIGTAGDTNVFSFARPGTGIYAVRLIFWPYWIAVAGDVGDTLFQCSVADSLGWALGLARSTDYALSKVRGARHVFCSGDAIRFAQGKDADNLAEWVDGYLDEQTAESFYQACHDDGVDDPPACTAYDADHVWAVEALAAFGAKYERMHP